MDIFAKLMMRTYLYMMDLKKKKEKYDVLVLFLKNILLLKLKKYFTQLYFLHFLLHLLLVL